MGRCGDCKHFSSEDHPAPFGTCRRWAQGYGVALADLKLNEVLVESDEGWAAIMGPEFGCVLYEPQRASR